MGKIGGAAKWVVAGVMGLMLVLVLVEYFMG